MAREHGTEGADGGVEESTESAARRYVIVGAPGTGKSDLELAVRETLPDLWHRPEPWLYVAPMGFQADYRSELLVASNRAAALNDEHDHEYISTHSLVDSLAYSITNARRLAQYDPTNERVDAWSWAAGAIMWMFRHSFRYNHIFLIQVDTLDDELFDFQELLQQVLDDNSLPYTILEGDPALWPEQVVEVIEGYGRN